MKQICCDERSDFQIALIQTGVDRFTVNYGLQSRSGLSYTEAATEYGLCLMHALACEGRLNNGEADDDDTGPGSANADLFWLTSPVNEHTDGRVGTVLHANPVYHSYLVIWPLLYWGD